MSNALQIIMLPVAELAPYAKNPRKNDHAVDAVAASIQEFGFKVPIILDSNKEIVAGHTRLKAAKALGMKEVPCIIADDLTPEQIRAFRLADNKVAELAEWDMQALAEELEELADWDMEAFGFDMDDFKDDIELAEVAEDEPPAVDETAEPRVKRGEVWKLGDHYLMCGDATVREDVEKLMSAGDSPRRG